MSRRSMSTVLAVSVIALFALIFVFVSVQQYYLTAPSLSSPLPSPAVARRPHICSHKAMSVTHPPSADTDTTHPRPFLLRSILLHMSAGISCFDIDATPTADGDIVVTHPNDFQQRFGLDITQVNADDIKRHDTFGTVMRLSELFTALSLTSHPPRIFIEPKLSLLSADGVNRLADILIRYSQVPSALIVQSLRFAMDVHHRLPQLPLVLPVRDRDIPADSTAVAICIELTPAAQRMSIINMHSYIWPSVKQVTADIMSAGSYCQRQRIQALRAATDSAGTRNIHIGVWTVDDIDTLLRVEHLTDYVVSNNAMALQEYMKRRTQT